VDQTGMVRLATAPPIDAVSSLTFPIMTPPRMVSTAVSSPFFFRRPEWAARCEEVGGPGGSG
jgi:hypothetical protein